MCPLLFELVSEIRRKKNFFIFYLLTKYTVYIKLPGLRSEELYRCYAIALCSGCLDDNDLVWYSREHERHAEQAGCCEAWRDVRRGAADDMSGVVNASLGMLFASS